MDVAARIDRANRWFDEGKHSSAIDSLRQLVRDVPKSRPARLALAELYRRLGHHEQAGRWSALQPEWATPQERGAFAVFLQQWSVAPRRVLVLGPDEPLPDLPALPRPPGLLARSGRRIGDQLADMVGPEWVRQSALGLWLAGWAVLAMAIMVVVGGLLIAWFVAGDDATEASLMRDVAIALGAAGLVLAGMMLLPSELLARRWTQVYSIAVGLVASGFVFASLGLGSLFSGG